MTSLSRLSRLKSAAAFLSAGWGGEEGIVGELQELQKQMNNAQVKSTSGKEGVMCYNLVVKHNTTYDYLYPQSLVLLQPKFFFLPYKL